jgi:predicted metal-dependent phosphoesterase TrpH
MTNARSARDGVVSIDCHVHTTDSYDSAATVDAVVGAAAEVGLDGLVVTDHDRIERSRLAAARAADFGLVGIPGVEVTTADGHLLAIGVSSRPVPGRPLAATVRAVRAGGGVAVVPHPFQLSRHGAPAPAIADCDGVEVFNAHSMTGVRNRQAKQFAEAHDYPHFAGSDAHHPSVVGRGVTHVDTGVSRPDADDIVAAMRAGRTQASGRRTPWRRYVGKLVENVRLRGTGVPSGD